MCARAVDARFLIMFVTRHHAKHMLNYEYLTAARILYSFSRGEVIKYSAQIFSSFSQCFIEFMQ